MTEDELLIARGKKPRTVATGANAGRPPVAAVALLDAADMLPELDELLDLETRRAVQPIGPHAAACIALRLAYALTHEQIAETLKISVDDVRKHLYAARRAGKLMDVAPLLDHVGVPMAVDNILKGIRNGDKDYTLALARGRGALRTFEKHEGEHSLELRVTVEGTPDATEAPEIIEGVVGLPRSEIAPPKTE